MKGEFCLLSEELSHFILFVQFIVLYSCYLVFLCYYVFPHDGIYYVKKADCVLPHSRISRRLRHNAPNNKKGIGIILINV